MQREVANGLYAPRQFFTILIKKLFTQAMLEAMLQKYLFLSKRLILNLLKKPFSPHRGINKNRRK